MAIDPCSETGPRISFSHDLCQTDIVPIEHYKSRLDSTLLDSNSDFNFCVSDRFEHESSSADELFSDGVILPIQIRERVVPLKQSGQLEPPPPCASRPPLPLPSTNENSKSESLKEIMATSFEYEQKPQSKSFWPFKRSTSLNCDNCYKRSSIWSLPLLSRSNSTGSEPNPKRMSSKDNQKQNSRKQPSVSMAKSSSTSSFYMYPLPQKPPLKKNNYGGSYGNGVRISPVFMNVPPPYISKGTANLFGLGSLFRNGKDKNKKK